MKKIKSKSRPAKNDWEPMRPCILLDSPGNWIAEATPVSGIYCHSFLPRRDAPVNDRAGFFKRLDRLHKHLRHVLPKDQALVVMAEGPIARGLGDRLHKFRKAYVIPSVDEFFDLLFHAARQNEDR
ncbi:MAG TPA: hypothetical protein VKD23_08615 [Terriglobales bacterium]|nr:hypothetical protein [Terriglobales bacterium]